MTLWSCVIEVAAVECVELVKTEELDEPDSVLSSEVFCFLRNDFDCSAESLAFRLLGEDIFKVLLPEYWGST